jgi:hypothetical protein
MKDYTYIPNSLRGAGRQIRIVLAAHLETLPKQDFVRAWSSVAYLYPGLHPDGFEDVDSGWPRVPKRFAAEAWRRADAGELADDELYTSDAQWCGIFDRMLVHFPDELKRRVELAVAFGDPSNA